MRLTLHKFGTASAVPLQFGPLSPGHSLWTPNDTGCSNLSCVILCHDRANSEIGSVIVLFPDSIVFTFSLPIPCHQPSCMNLLAFRFVNLYEIEISVAADFILYFYENNACGSTGHGPGLFNETTGFQKTMIESCRTFWSVVRAMLSYVLTMWTETDLRHRYSGIIMCATASQIIGALIVCPTFCLGAKHRKHQSAIVRGQ